KNPSPKMITFCAKGFAGLPILDLERELADDFGRIHGFPTCLGSLDGKHIGIIMPKNAGSRYFNYKGFHIIILLALVNARKEFLMVDVGINGRISDGGVLFYSKFWQSYEQGLLNLPNPINLSNMTHLFPCVFVADEAFALGLNLMKPYSQKYCSSNELISNQKSSRARSTVECAFGILAKRFEPDKATTLTLTCCYLHNFLIKENSSLCLNQEKDSPSVSITNLQSTQNRNATINAKIIRDNY
ncbi:hypothetical protein SFRURICE_015784, partial [Spodoptera frugiperda]